MMTNSREPTQQYDQKLQAKKDSCSTGSTNVTPVSLSTWRCSKKPDMYLFTEARFTADELLNILPEGLLKVTGRLVHALDLDVTPQRKLARASAAAVLESVADKGWYLQMPPGDTDSEVMRTIISAERSGNRPL